MVQKVNWLAALVFCQIYGLGEYFGDNGDPYVDYRMYKYVKYCRSYFATAALGFAIRSNGPFCGMFKIWRTLS